MKTSLFRPLLILLLTFSLQSMTVTAGPVKDVTENAEQRAQQLERRLEDIKAIDRRTLSKSDKKSLRTEVRGIKKEMAEMKGGLYLSIGAILIIALLLIILL